VSDPQDLYYRTMNTCVQALIFIAGWTLAAVAWPLILYIRGDAVTVVSFCISGLAVLAIFTLFYTPGYFMFGGLAVGAGAWIYMMVTYDVPEWIGVGWEFRTALLIFFLVGIVLKFLRNNGGGSSSTPTSLNLKSDERSEPVHAVTKFKVEFL